MSRALCRLINHNLKVSYSNSPDELNNGRLYSVETERIDNKACPKS